MRKNIALTFVILFLFGAVSFVNPQAISVNGISYALFDFETNLLGWEPRTETTGSDFYITSDLSHSGASSACLVGRTKYRFQFANETAMEFT
ncbi:MAG: hypothetical protein ACTSR1_00670, partial [Candidatus Heimdallarchaeota archaeon]